LLDKSGNKDDEDNEETDLQSKNSFSDANGNERRRE